MLYTAACAVPSRIMKARKRCREMDISETLGYEGYELIGGIIPLVIGSKTLMENPSSGDTIFLILFV